jgi:glycosyltransferase involved in cell wall biosynthesis
MNIKVTLINSGGQGHYLIGLVKGLAKNGVSIDVIDSDDTRDVFKNLSSVRHYSFVRWSGFNQPLYKKILRTLLYPFLLFVYIIFTNSNIIHMQWEGNNFKWFYRYLIPNVCRLRSKKLVVTAHNVNVQLRDRGKTDEYEIKSLYYFYRHCDGIIAHTKSIKEELLSEFKLVPDRIHIIPHGCNDAIPITKMSCLEARQKLGLSKDAKVFLLFGGYRRSKNYELLIHAMPRVLNLYPEAITLIVGDCANAEDYLLELRELAEKLGISESVKFYPHRVLDKEIEVYFKAADCIVLPYKSIFMSGIPFTAFIFGLPVIASRIGGLPEMIVDGKYGFLFEAENLKELEEKLLDYFKSDLYCNSSKRNEIREYVQKCYSWSNISQKTIELYKLIKINNSNIW